MTLICFFWLFSFKILLPSALQLSNRTNSSFKLRREGIIRVSKWMLRRSQGPSQYHLGRGTRPDSTLQRRNTQMCFPFRRCGSRGHTCRPPRSLAWSRYPTIQMHEGGLGARHSLPLQGNGKLLRCEEVYSVSRPGWPHHLNASISCSSVVTFAQYVCPCPISVTCAHGHVSSILAVIKVHFILVEAHFTVVKHNRSRVGAAIPHSASMGQERWTSAWYLCDRK